jgi:hypothetical protein
MSLSACKISTLISNVDGLASNSASPVITWIITLQKPYKNTNKLFLKIHLNPTYLNPEMKVIDNKKFVDLQRKTAGLIYENDVYRKIIKPLINKNICTNFIKNFGSGKSCDYEDLLSCLLNNTLSDKRKILTNEECVHNLNRSIAFIYEMDKGRPSINDIEPKISNEMSKILYEKFKNFKFNILINEVLENSITFGDYIFERTHKPQDFWAILFQLSVACYAMSLSKMNHNDAHVNNIFLKKFDKDEYMLYYINEIPVIIKSSYKVFIYDFDRSYVESLGVNYLLTDKTCRDTSQCNKFFENKDIIKILCNVYNTSKDINTRKKIINLISLEETTKKDIEKIYRHMSIYTGKIQCFLVNEKEETLSEEVFKKFNTTEQILFNIVKELKNIGNYDNNTEAYTSIINRNNVSVCNKKFFNDNGTINIK